MKRLISIVVCLLVLVSAAGCSGKYESGIKITSQEDKGIAFLSIKEADLTEELKADIVTAMFILNDVEAVDEDLKAEILSKKPDYIYENIFEKKSELTVNVWKYDGKVYTQNVKWEEKYVGYNSDDVYFNTNITADEFDALFSKYREK